MFKTSHCVTTGRIPEVFLKTRCPDQVDSVKLKEMVRHHGRVMVK